MTLDDSMLDAAGSIERRLLADLPDGERDELSSSIERALFAEARAGELTLASLRMCVVLVALLCGAALFLIHRSSPRAFAAIVAACFAWLALGLALLAGLRRGWYRRWLRFAAPLVDGVMIAVVCSALWQLGDRSPRDQVEVFGFAAALCAYLAISGAPRLSRSAMQWSTAVACIILLGIATLSGAGIIVAFGAVALLVLVGVLGSRAPVLIRRVVMNEVGRSAMTRRYDEARQTVEAREQVLKIVSHDLRTPLHTVAMSTSLLLEGAGTDEQRHRQLAIIRRAGERMNRLVKDLLDVAKLEAGQLAIQPRAIEAAPLLAEADETLRPVVEEHALHLETDVRPDLPMIQADAGRVLQVLSNLVSNAVKFTPPGGRISIRVVPEGRQVRLSVTDTGCGIPPGQLSQVFGRFWQADPADRRGIGLGLAISKAIVEAHGGRIWVESRVGEGTTFHFTLSASEPSAAPAAMRTRHHRPDFPLPASPLHPPPLPPPG